MCDKVVPEDPFTLKYCHDIDENEEFCDKNVNSCLLALKFVPDWSVVNEMIAKLDIVVFFNDYIIFGDLDFDFVTLFGSDIGLYSINLDNTNLDDENFHYCHQETFNHVRLMG